MGIPLSTVTEVYDAVAAKVGSLLPGFSRIPNPYAVDENTALLLKKGYGVAVGEGVNTKRYVGCISTWRRTFNIGIVHQVINTENDTEGKARVEKTVLEVQDTLLLGFERDPTLGGVVVKAEVESDSGVQYTAGDQGKFLALEISLEVEYQSET